MERMQLKYDAHAREAGCLIVSAVGFDCIPAELGAAMIREHADGDWQVPVLAASATRGTGIEALAETLEAHHQFLLQRNALSARRRSYQTQWIGKRLEEEFGRFGVRCLGGPMALHESLLAEQGSLYAIHESYRQRLLQRYR